MRDHMPATVFVVDDDDDSRDLLFRLVRSCGWYAAGYKIEQMCQGVLPIMSADCILLDLALPDMAGLKVLDALRQHGVDTPVIAMIANAAADATQHASAAGMRVVLHKPVERERLRSTVLQVIAATDAPIASEPMVRSGESLTTLDG